MNNNLHPWLQDPFSLERKYGNFGFYYFPVFDSEFSNELKEFVQYVRTNPLFKEDLSDELIEQFSILMFVSGAMIGMYLFQEIGSAKAENLRRVHQHVVKHVRFKGRSPSALLRRWLESVGEFEKKKKNCI